MSELTKFPAYQWWKELTYLSEIVSKKRAKPAQKLLWYQTLTTEAVLEVRRSFMIVVILTEGAIPTTQCDDYDDDDDRNYNWQSISPSTVLNSLTLPPPLPLLSIPQKAFHSGHPLHCFSDIILFSNWQNINWWNCLTGILLFYCPDKQKSFSKTGKADGSWGGNWKEHWISSQKTCLPSGSFTNAKLNCQIIISHP